MTKNGSGQRDMEKSYTFDPSLFTKIYQGRSVLPERTNDFESLPALQDPLGRSG